MNLSPPPDLADIISLREAARRMPARRKGRPCSPSTLWRWAKTGLRGVRLQTWRLGGTLCTTAKALREFIEAMSATDSVCVMAPSPAPAARQAAAEATLREAGISSQPIRRGMTPIAMSASWMIGEGWEILKANSDSLIAWRDRAGLTAIKAVWSADAKSARTELECDQTMKRWLTTGARLCVHSWTSAVGKRERPWLRLNWARLVDDEILWHGSRAIKMGGVRVGLRGMARY